MRIVDLELCKSYQGLPCLCCGDTTGTVGHHIKSKGSGGDDVKENLMPLCVEHHHKIHTYGLTRMCKEFAAVKWFVLDNGYEYDFTFKRYMKYSKIEQ